MKLFWMLLMSAGFGCHVTFGFVYIIARMQTHAVVSFIYAGFCMVVVGYVATRKGRV